MKIVYYTSGVTGSGRIVRGIAIGNAFRRKGIDAEYFIIHSSNFGFLPEKLSYKTIKLEPEDVDRFTKQKFSGTQCYKTLISLKPDVLIVDLLWFPLHNFLNELGCKKIFISRQVEDRFFTLPLPEEKMIFRHNDYDYVLAIEPFKSSIPMKNINPIVIRNRDEIYSKEKAAELLKINPDNKNCLLAYNGHPNDFNRVKNDFNYLKQEGYEIFYTTNYNNGIFPAVDYFNAFDLLVCGAGYNAFWESVYFDKEAIIIPTKAGFESGERRIAECSDYDFDENGADQLVDMIMGM